MGQENDKYDDPNELIKAINKSGILKHPSPIQIFSPENNNKPEKDNYLLLKNISKEYKYLKEIKSTISFTLNDIEMKKNKRIKKRFSRLKKWIKLAQCPPNTTVVRRNSSHFASRISFIKTLKDNDLLIENLNNEDDNSIKDENCLDNYRYDNNIFFDKNNNDNNDNNDNNESNELKKFNLSKYDNKSIENGLYNFYNREKEHALQKLEKGPPNCFRMICWIIRNNLLKERSTKKYIYFLKADIDEKTDNAIKKDIVRTFNKEPASAKFEYENMLEDKLQLQCLYNILKSYAILDNEITYCQGMNILVGFILIISNFNEVDTFYLMCSLFSSTYITRNTIKFNFSIRGLFIEGFPLLLFLVYIFEECFKKYLPELHSKFEEWDIPLDIYITKWYQTLFTIVLPVKLCRRLWDYLFANDIYFMIPFSICLLEKLNKIYIKYLNEDELVDFFKTIQKNALSFNPDFFQFIDVKKHCNKNNILDIDMETLLEESKKIEIDIYYFYHNYKVNENPDFENIMTKSNNTIFDFNAVKNLIEFKKKIKDENESQVKTIYKNNNNNSNNILRNSINKVTIDKCSSEQESPLDEDNQLSQLLVNDKTTNFSNYHFNFIQENNKIKANDNKKAENDNKIICENNDNNIITNEKMYQNLDEESNIKNIDNNSKNYNNNKNNNNELENDTKEIDQKTVGNNCVIDNNILGDVFYLKDTNNNNKEIKSSINRYDNEDFNNNNEEYIDDNFTIYRKKSKSNKELTNANNTTNKKDTLKKMKTKKRSIEVYDDNIDENLENDEFEEFDDFDTNISQTTKSKVVSNLSRYSLTPHSNTIFFNKTVIQAKVNDFRKSPTIIPNMETCKSPTIIPNKETRSNNPLFRSLIIKKKDSSKK